MKAEIVLGRVFLALLSCLLAFFVVEYASRWFISPRSPLERQFPVEDVRQPQPYKMFGGRADRGGLNALGYPGTAPSLPKADREFRIFLLGGSTVFNGDPTIAELLEEEFRNKGISHARVYNFGVVSSVSSMEVTRLTMDLLDLLPDLVVFYNGGNDILHPWSWDPRPGYPFNFVAYESNPLLETDVGDYPAIAMLAFESNIARYLFGEYFTRRFTALDELRRQAGWKTEGWREEIEDIYLANLMKADKIADAFGAGFIAFFQPMVFSKSGLDHDEVRYRDQAGGEKKAYVIDMQARIRDRIRRPDTPEARVVDISRIYDNVREKVFWDEIHTYQSAKPTIARRMFDEISEARLIRARPTP